MVKKQSNNGMNLWNKDRINQRLRMHKLRENHHIILNARTAGKVIKNLKMRWDILKDHFVINVNNEKKISNDMGRPGKSRCVKFAEQNLMDKKISKEGMDKFTFVT